MGQSDYVSKFPFEFHFVLFREFLFLGLGIHLYSPFGNRGFENQVARGFRNFSSIDNDWQRTTIILIMLSFIPIAKGHNQLIGIALLFQPSARSAIKRNNVILLYPRNRSLSPFFPSFSNTSRYANVMFHSVLPFYRSPFLRLSPDPFRFQWSSVIISTFSTCHTARCSIPG